MEVGSGEIIQSVKCLPYKHKDLSLDSRAGKVEAGQFLQLSG